jgi:YidC/Oxa1 family membrane protein insertase
MTLILKFVSLPFTLAASKSAKRMAKLQPLMQEIREKYKDNPQKQQQATMELFKAHKVNPLGGCIPILITFPLFIGFFAMLQGSAELRFQSFLWASDLAAPDTVARIWRIPINVMPLLIGRHDVLPDAAHADPFGRQRAGQDDEVHARDLHAVLSQLLRALLALLDDQRPLHDHPAVDCEPHQGRRGGRRHDGPRWQADQERDAAEVIRRHAPWPGATNGPKLSG